MLCTPVPTTVQLSKINSPALLQEQAFIFSFIPVGTSSKPVHIHVKFTLFANLWAERERLTGKLSSERWRPELEVPAEKRSVDDQTTSCQLIPCELPCGQTDVIMLVFFFFSPSFFFNSPSCAAHPPTRRLTSSSHAGSDPHAVFPVGLPSALPSVNTLALEGRMEMEQWQMGEGLTGDE